MPHSVIDILRQLEESDLAADDSAAVQTFKREIWHMPIWINGTMTLSDSGVLSTSLKLVEAIPGADPVVRVCLDETQALNAWGKDECFRVTFRVLLVFAERQRMYANIYEGDEEFLVPHEQLMALRDQGGVGGAGIPMSEREVLQHRACATELAKRARSYCAAHSDIESLHLAIIMMSGVKAVVAATLKAERMQEHTSALSQISRDVLQPRWRFSMFDFADGVEGVASSLVQLAPCFSKARDTGIWNKFKNAFSAPVLGIIEVEVDPDPTARTLDDTEVAVPVQ